MREAWHRQLHRFVAWVDGEPDRPIFTTVIWHITGPALPAPCLRVHPALAHDAADAVT